VLEAIPKIAIPSNRFAGCRFSRLRPFLEEFYRFFLFNRPTGNGLNCMQNSGGPMDAVHRTILNGVINLRFGISVHVHHLNVSGIIQAEYFRAGFHSYTADDAITEFDNRRFHFIR
jgi:hypothetical protein